MLTLRNNFTPAQRRLNNIFDDFFTSPLLMDFNPLPAFNKEYTTDETDTSYNLEFPIPGLSKEDIKIEAKGKNLSVSYEAKDENKKSFFSTSFKKTFLIPENVDANKIKATSLDGILRIDLPKKKDSKTKIIEIQ